MKSRRLTLPTCELPMRWWTVRFDSRAYPDAYGMCDHARRVITINRDAAPLEQLSTLMHEVGHAVRGYDEDVVEAHEQATMKAIRLAHKVWPNLADEIKG